MERSGWYAWMVPIAFVLPILTRWMFKIWWFNAPIRPLPDRIGRTVFALGVCLMAYLAFVFAIDEPPMYDWETAPRRRMILLVVAALAFSGPLFAYMHYRRVDTAYHRDGPDEGLDDSARSPMCRCCGGWCSHDKGGGSPMPRWLLVAAFFLNFSPLAEAQAPKRLKVSENRRFLVTGENEPFFWLGDTAWELFHRLNREEATEYLSTRSSQGFNVIQAVAIAELDGHKVPNAYGHLPLVDQDPARPATKEGPDNDYWDHVDFIVEQANARGIVVALLPTWGRYWHDPVKDGKPLFTRENARIYGEWLGKRYKDRSIVWVLGGDRNVENDEQKEVIRAMAEGLHRGDGGAHLRTFHPRGGGGSSQYFHNDSWLDFNMRQNGHEADFPGRYSNTRKDYDLTPVKPVLDAEPIYEDHPISFNAQRFGHSVAADVRRPIYWDVFTGAFGHTYGNHAIWQMYAPGRPPINSPLMPWSEALNQPGGQQMRYARNLMESRPFLDRIPDDSIIVADRVPTLIPGAGRYRFVATRDKAGTYAFVYVPVGRTFSVRMDAIKGEKVIARWFNPRAGSVEEIETFPNNGTRAFTPPSPGEALDWILVLDDASKAYPPPGAARGR